MTDTMNTINLNRKAVFDFLPELKNSFETVFAVDMPAYKQSKSDSIRSMYRINLENGAYLVVELSYIDINLTDPKNMMLRWHKAGYIKEALPNFWAISTYYTIKDEDGFEKCVERFNPQHLKGKINFDWILPASFKNREVILSEIERLAKNA